jgi:hypothetical protein
MTEQRLTSTVDAAKRLGMRPEALRVILQRNAALQPKLKIGNTWLWTPEEVEAVRNRNRKPGRPAKDGD